MSPLAGVRRRWAVALLAGVLALAACGQQSPPAAVVPELADLQAQVAQAVQDEDWEAARAGLDDLVSVAEAAGASGALPSAQVDDVVTAAEGLAVTLPATEPSPAPEPAPPAEAEEPRDEDPGDGDSDGDSDEDSDGDSDEDSGDDSGDGGRSEDGSDPGKGKGKGKGKDDD